MGNIWISKIRENDFIRHYKSRNEFITAIKHARKKYFDFLLPLTDAVDTQRLK